MSGSRPQVDELAEPLTDEQWDWVLTNARAWPGTKARGPMPQPHDDVDEDLIRLGSDFQ